MEKHYLFDFLAFIEELRQDESDREIVEKYEKIVLKGEKIKGDIKDQKWYKEYLSKFNRVPNYKKPESFEDEFDWELLFQLIAGSLCSDYWLEYPDISRLSEPELVVKVTQGNETNEKKISELWSFQILRLFEIYILEQIRIETTNAEEDTTEEDIKFLNKERNKNLRKYSKILKPGSQINLHSQTPRKSKKTKEIEDSIVYHYCSLESAYHIIRSGIIFSSDLSYMNDSDELQFGINIMIDALNAIICKKNINKDYKQWIRSFLSMNEHSLRSNLEDESVYITCFSKKADDLNQWRAYGNNGFGLCLKFDFKVLLYDPLTEDYTQGPVIYLNKRDHSNDKNWKDVVSDIQKYFYNLWKESKDNTKSLYDVLEMIPDRLKIGIRFYKNDDFKEEGEYRLVSMNSKDRIVKTRPGKECLIPYIEMPLENEKKESALKGIIIGPSIHNKSRMKKSLITFLKELDRNNDTNFCDQVSIDSSSIPYIP